MKNLLRLSVWLLLAASVLPLASCENNTEIEPSKAQLLTSGEWKGVSIYAAGKDITQLVMKTEDFDVRRLLIEFNKDGTFRDNNGGKQSTGTWELTENNQALIINKGTKDEWRFTLNKITQKELYLGDKFYDEEGKLFDGEMRFSH